MHEAMLATFNQFFREFAEPLTEHKLEQAPKGDTGNRRDICRYALFSRDEKVFLAGYAMSRFTNSRYLEIDEKGEVVYQWADIDFIIIDDSEFNSSADKNNLEGMARIRAAGINMPWEKG